MDIKGEIITIGNELLSGVQVDTNGAYLAGRLRGRGVDVVRITSVGDEQGAIIQALNESRGRAHVVVVTGGLGPTGDDITAASVARSFDCPLVVHEEALTLLEGVLRSYGLAVTENQKKQACLPHGAEVIPNPTGTAPGFLMKEDGRLLFVLPGVPRELAVMVEETVLNRIEQEWPDRPHYCSRTLKLFGLSEARADELLRGLVFDEDLKLAFLPCFPEVHVKIEVHAAIRETGEERLRSWEQELRKRLHPYVFGTDNDTMEGAVGALLREAGATLAVAESCTGGLIGHRLTEIPGSSDYLERVAVVYSNQSKVDLLQVPQPVIAAHGAVSEPVARLMAEGVRAASGTTLGLATTGIAGPGGGTPEKPAGTVFIALAYGTDTWVKRYRFLGDRGQVKLLTSQVALNRVRRHLLEKADKRKEHVSVQK